MLPLRRDSKLYQTIRYRVVGCLYILDGLDLIVRGSAGGTHALKWMLVELQFWYKRGQ